MVAAVVVENGDGEVLAEASDTADATVARERGGEASVGGSGSLTVETGE